MSLWKLAKRIVRPLTHSFGGDIRRSHMSNSLLDLRTVDYSILKVRLLVDDCTEAWDIDHENLAELEKAMQKAILDSLLILVNEQPINLGNPEIQRIQKNIAIEFQYKLPIIKGKLHIRNELLMDHYPDQQNHLQLLTSEGVKRITFKLKQTELDTVV